jgi:hypothetical protein
LHGRNPILLCGRRRSTGILNFIQPHSIFPAMNRTVQVLRIALRVRHDAIKANRDDLTGGSLVAAATLIPLANPAAAGEFHPSRSPPLKAAAGPELHGNPVAGASI